MLLLDEALDLPNPNPTRISDALWRFWRCLDRRVGSALLGGIYAAKKGYHNYRLALTTGDYSVGQVAADRRGSDMIAAAIDITLSDMDMRLLTGRLDRAARGRDPRLYIFNGPTLREFIGTLNSSTVYCYVLTGGIPLGVGSDSGPDPGRDKTHLWHIHLSIIREYAGNPVALDGVLSVMIGESPQAWMERMAGSMALETEELKYLAYASRDAEALRKGSDTITGDANVTAQSHWGVQTLRATAAGVSAIAAAIPGVDEAVKAQLDGALAALQAAVHATPAQVVSLLAAQPAEDAAQLVLASVGRERTEALRDALSEVLTTAPGE